MAKVQIKNEWKMWLGIGIFGLLIIASLYWVSRPPTEGGEYLWMVTEIVDGNTIRVKGSGEEMKVSIIALDTPAPIQPQARDYLEGELLNQWVRIKPIATIDEDHKKGFVYISGEDMTARLIRRGLAKVDTSEKSVDTRAFVELEQEAKRAKRGLWSKTQEEAD
jgi:endonuclease YncB( thermonuclease family)